jgi:hypothetical protein
MPLIIIIQSDEKEKIKCKTETICNEEHGQSSGLSTVVHFVALGCSSRLKKASVPQTTCHQKKEQPRKKAALFLLSAFLVFTRSLPFVRRGFYICKTAPKLRPTLEPFLHLSPRHFLAVALPPAINLNGNVPQKKRD